jgi:hypothetical protein
VDCIISNNTAFADGGGVCGDHGGGTARRCVIVDNAAGREGGGGYGMDGLILEGCTVRLNRAAGNGGGVLLLFGSSGPVRDCVIAGNTAVHGGGAYLDLGGEILNGLVVSNTATGSGGEVYFHSGGELRNCAVSGNDAGSLGGGAVIEGEGNVYNSILYHNAGENWSGYGGGTGPTFGWCCTVPDPGATGCITNPPQFVDAGAGNFRLREGSACIDRGSNERMPSATDLAGVGRPLDSDTNGAATVDMGAYEFAHPRGDTDGDEMTDGYEAEKRLNPADAADVAADPDADGVGNHDEWVADTDPRDSTSCLRVTRIAGNPVTEVWFRSSSNRLYTLQRAGDPAGNAWSNVPGQGPRAGSGGAECMTDAAPAPRHFYRLRADVP